ncbi:MAG: polyprenyl synthetase family protein [Thermoflexales bacterium]|nr:polyprenyl synthetase family protein [Thermoflexales bacterium]
MSTHSASSSSLAHATARFLPHIEAEMRAVINADEQPKPFNTMLNYHLGFANPDGSPAQVSAGKRIRPVLTLLSCEACGEDWQKALPAAAAVELLHNFSLIHDDIEDRDELRRGRPTVWAIWGVPQAINAGDAMFVLAHLALLRSAARGVPADRLVRAMLAFEQMCLQLTIGQHLDLSFETRSDVTAEEYMRMIAGKTAALISAACRIGAIIAGAEDAQVEVLAAFGHNLGLSFQLQDDVLGIWGDPNQTGKPTSDLIHRKKTLPVLYAADRDPSLRPHLFALHPISETQAEALRAQLEALGAKSHTEAEAARAFAAARAALMRLPSSQARDTLEALASSLLRRQQ